jgi:triosephosphate isomerase
LRHSLPDGFAGLVAYEPIWAIGTGRTPTFDEITAMHAAIRAALVAQYPAGGGVTPILYGGSVKPGNAAAILALPDVGGALVGGASLIADDFLAIAAAAPPD